MSRSTRSSKRPSSRPRYTARNSDPHTLYQLAVQSPREDVRFLARVYRTIRGREPFHLREDFCGTALLCATWVRGHEERTAEGYDLCAETMAWGRAHNFPSLGERAENIALVQADVRAKSRRRPDLRCAQNFSYFVFKQRAELLEYFSSVRRDLAPGGVFALDIYGGSEASDEMEEERKIAEGFTYVWHQKGYDPVTGDYRTAIHFRFRDGSERRNAFTYDWRLWTLPEVKDVLHEAGFPKVDTYWEGTSADGDGGNGIYRISRKGENCPAWVTYLVAYR